MQTDFQPAALHSGGDGKQSGSGSPTVTSPNGEHWQISLAVRKGSK